MLLDPSPHRLAVALYSRKGRKCKGGVLTRKTQKVPNDHSNWDDQQGEKFNMGKLYLIPVDKHIVSLGLSTRFERRWYVVFLFFSLLLHLQVGMTLFYKLSGEIHAVEIGLWIRMRLGIFGEVGLYQ